MWSWGLGEQTARACWWMQQEGTPCVWLLNADCRVCIRLNVAGGKMIIALYYVKIWSYYDLPSFNIPSEPATCSCSFLPLSSVCIQCCHTQDVTSFFSHVPLLSVPSLCSLHSVLPYVAHFLLLHSPLLPALSFHKSHNYRGDIGYQTPGDFLP